MNYKSLLLGNSQMFVIKHKSFHFGFQEAQLHKWTLASYPNINYMDTCPISPEVFMSSWFLSLEEFHKLPKIF